jgi:ketosteroid isomerase-like protein
MSKPRRFFRFVAVVLGSLACLALGPAPVRADAAADATAQSKAFERAMNAKDVQGLLALYADDARVTFPGQGEEATGKAEIERLLTDTVEAFQGAQTTLASQTAVPLAGDYTGIVGRWVIVFKEPDGSAHTVHLRTSQVIKQDGERTLYVIDHQSIGVQPTEDDGDQTPGTPSPPQGPGPG